MRSEDFDIVAGLIKRRAGLVLTADKSYLLDSRLTPVARRFGLGGLAELAAALRKGGDTRLEVAVTEAMTTNESSFFRDRNPFDQLRDTVLPRLMEARTRTRRLRIWSAACSRGQEPYSIAMVMHDLLAAHPGWRAEILATDLNTEILDQARAGEFSQFEIQRGLPAKMMITHFDQIGERWRAKEYLRRMVTFQPRNLLEPFTGMGPFDIVFCRNVLIYFDAQTKADVLTRLAGIMPTDGYLFLGGAETVLGVTEAFKPAPDLRGIYARPEAHTGPGAAANPKPATAASG